ncbi:MAG TPA: site-specific DNA-methyltransferase, partial [Alphaproteobacteria bacterium]|nr:site-specific DNA-methyltransferase [Alphaproteobacteria bacterium]
MIYACMDFRHAFELLQASRQCRLRYLNLCVWRKNNGGMGSFYRSQHELVFVFKKGTAPHLNTIELGRYGRYRTNVWEYAGVNSFRSGRLEELQMHPTVKPVALVGDALKDASRRGEIVLDGFAGSGTILIAAEKTGRRARAIELEPRYVDVAVRRWERLTGRSAHHAKTG